VAFVGAYLSAREGQLSHASRAAAAALDDGRAPEQRAFGLALASMGVRRDEPETVAALEASLAADNLCDPDLAWALHHASLQATDPSLALRLARLSAAAWRRLWRHACP